MNNDSKTTDKTQALMKSGKAAEFLGVPHRTFKFWVKAGKLIPDFVSEKGYNFFSEENLARFKAKAGNETEQNAQNGTKAGNASSDADIKSQIALIPTSTRAVIEFVDAEKEILFNNTPNVFPDTQFSPKDKVSNVVWNNEIDIGDDIGVITIFKSENFGCIVKLNYEKIMNSNDVITGAELSPYDRNVYDSVVTLYAAGNKIFPLQDIWRVFSQNPSAKLTEVERKKLLKSLFHIARFWITIVTDYSEKTEVWAEKNSNPDNKPFKPERKFYKKLQSSYTGHLLEFRVIANRRVETVHSNNGQEVIEKETTAEILELGFCPILYQYAKAKGQVASTPIKLLNTSDRSNKKIVINRGYHNDEITTFLAREIDTMKKSSTYNNIILLERFYIIDGINEVQTDTNSVNKKKKKTRDKIEKILSHFKINGIIKDYIFHKKTFGKASTFYSIEILV